MQKVSLEHLPELAANVLAIVWMQEPKNTATVVALKGELGAGKTTFVQALAKRLGVLGSIVSPTYVLMKSYDISGTNSSGTTQRFSKLIHIDAYRLEKPEEFAALRPEEFLSDPKNLVIVEWPEKVGDALPTPDVTVNFSSEGAAQRERYIEVV